MSDVVFMPHQQDAIDRLKSGMILCGGVGTGKSITALGYYLKESNGKRVPLYIITTARKRDTGEWKQECAHFDFPDGLVTVDSWNNIKKYEAVSDAFVIFDEQRVVGSGAWVKSFLKMTKANRWLLLTATPGDTWMDYIPVFVANGFYKNRSQFLRRHAVYNRYSKYPKVDKWLEPGYLESLRRRITVLMKYDKSTERHWQTVSLGYDEELYRKVMRDRWDPWKKEPIKDISGACYLMRRVVNDDTRRLDAIRMLLDEHPRTIIFYNYDYELERLRQLRDEWTVAEWNGHVHESLPEGDRWIYLVQYTAGCEGWNCTTTDTVIFYSQNYSYKIMEQAAGRIDRLNTPYHDLWYFVLKSNAPIDIAISRAIRGKKTFNEKLFVGPRLGLIQ